MIKSLLIGTISATISALSLIPFSITPVKTQVVNAPQQQQLAVNILPPPKLLDLARQGRFNAQGIPGYSRLNSYIKSGKVNAQTLVAGAIEQNRLPEAALQDVGYLQAINDHLKSGGCGSL